MTIVVGYVPTPEGNAALERAVQEARARQGDLVVVDLSRHERNDPSELEARAAELAGGDVRFQTQGVEDGKDSVDTILAVAVEHDADLLVIGLRRRTPVGKLILGAQAQRILLDAACPVLAVKPDVSQRD
ncbi:universal stress protein [Leekyejoonella antrihumi]|uniref:Universal stress protein n=1 Tax=Leekyejoonella antrihumi TaxID=1660198 RepID=A0A563DY48_9MICO|nr:universal stress protein [Leekyejoonella antrihumi]TWP35198.1 universal stress protein [Leekyejoonella antrihumi]